MLTFQLKKLLILLETDVVVEDDGEVSHYNKDFQVNPLLLSDFRHNVTLEAGVRQLPYIFQDKFGVCFAYFYFEKTHYFIGPMSLLNFSRDSLVTYLNYYDLKNQHFSLKIMTLNQILDLIVLVVQLVTGKVLKTGDLLAANEQLVNIKQEVNPLLLNLDYELGAEEVVQAHHTYQEERHLLEYVKRGAVSEALAYQNAMDKSIGRLSNKEVNHWKNLAIVAITLTTRAAIDGGLTPALAYKISDKYIQECDKQKTVAQMIAIRNQAVRELTESVKYNLKVQTQSSYIKASTHYIDQHYREKIYLKDVANFVGLSTTYFSKLFKQEVGMAFQNYVTQVRLEYAANLLRYSNESISVISEYVNFPSQSYFGRYFKEFYHMTPKEYRDLYHISG